MFAWEFTALQCSGFIYSKQKYKVETGLLSSSFSFFGRVRQMVARDAARRHHTSWFNSTQPSPDRGSGHGQDRLQLGLRAGLQVVHLAVLYLRFVSSREPLYTLSLSTHAHAHATFNLMVIWASPDSSGVGSQRCPKRQHWQRGRITARRQTL